MNKMINKFFEVLDLIQFVLFALIALGVCTAGVLFFGLAFIRQFQ